MRHPGSKYLRYVFLFSVLSSTCIAAESIKAEWRAVARQATAADINREFELLEQEVLAEELARKQSPLPSQSKGSPSAKLTEDSSIETQLVAQYTEIIRNTIARNSTYLPDTDSHREVVIHIRLAPKGHLISSAIDQSSGEPRFDYAALQAVEKAERFPELQDLPAVVYERNFRDFNLSLGPGDLLR